ncbi:MAG: zinc-binding dehydrogenase [Streptosporangiales bacterium]|nr:zinc-binding dehydrogenase [Streptosporangiales bacterium]
MRAAYITEVGPAENITIGDLAEPTPGPTDVLVRTQAMAVNHVDTFVRAGTYPVPMTFPFVVGRDLVGTVAAVGAAVTDFRVGEPVWCNSLGYGGRQGSFAEYANVPGDRLYLLPAGVEPVPAVALLHTAATAYLGLFREAQLRYGETVLVSGAAGGVGSAVVQLAAAAGATVIATARDDDADWCRACGASEVVDYRDPDLWTKVAAAAPGGIDVFWENSTHYAFEHTLPLLARGGRFIVIAGRQALPSLPIGQLYVNDASLRGFVISNASAADLADAARAVNRGLADGVLRASVAAELPLAEAADAHRQLEAGATRGRIVVVP